MEFTLKLGKAFTFTNMLPFEKILFPHTGDILQSQSLGGGCIHHATHIRGEKGDFFFKWNDASEAANFKAEEKGLSLLKEKSSLRIPQVISFIAENDRAGLLIEYIAPGHKKPAFYQKLGEGLALQHLQSQAAFGLDHDNFIGALPQRNREYQRWPDFFREERILPQLAMPNASRLLGASSRKRIDQLFKKLDAFFPEEKPALLHGDLWGGNLLCDTDSKPVLIDPAVYYGHREMELAFMQLFDSYPVSFYDAYQAVYPMASGWEERMDLYNLYPMLVHLNLFGGGYLSGVERIIAKYG